jgi:hypothetical protein
MVTTSSSVPTTSASSSRRISQHPGAGTFMGFFDFCSPDRLPLPSRERFAGKCTGVAAFVTAACGQCHLYRPADEQCASHRGDAINEFRDATA